MADSQVRALWWLDTQCANAGGDSEDRTSTMSYTHVEERHEQDSVAVSQVRALCGWLHNVACCLLIKEGDNLDAKCLHQIVFVVCDSLTLTVVPVQQSLFTELNVRLCNLSPFPWLGSRLGRSSWRSCG